MNSEFSVGSGVQSIHPPPASGVSPFLHQDPLPCMSPKQELGARQGPAPRSEAG